MPIPKQCVIIGGGSSIRQNLWDTPIEYLPIWKAVQNKFTITINWSFLWHRPTIAMFNDYRFYATEKERLDKLPLVIGQQDSFYDREPNIKGYNLYLLHPSKGYNDGSGMRNYYWGEDSWKHGFYSPQLSGLMALTFAIRLGCMEIYLLGMDWGQIDGYTHFYEDTKVGHIIWEGREQSGVGLKPNGDHNTGRYDIKRNNAIVKVNNPDYWYDCYKQEKNVKIYNVSPQSNITSFEKIGFDVFYKTMEPRFPAVIQSETRKEIRRIINDKQTEYVR